MRLRHAIVPIAAAAPAALKWGMTGDDPDLSPNPFEAALREGAAATYLSMAEAGLAELFDPLPKGPSGEGLASLALDRPLGPHAGRFVEKLLELGADPCALHRPPERMRHRAPGLSAPWDAPLPSAPLASIAIAMGMPAYAPLWRSLPPERLASIAPTALPWACSAGDIDAVKALLAAGADPDLVDAEGWPAAARCRDAACLAALADAGANLRAAMPVQRGGARTVHGFFLSDPSMSEGPKALRLACVSWAAAHPEEGGLAGSDLAQEAFRAIDADNRDSARRCVKALGESSSSRRDDRGRTLLTAACSMSNYPEANRLLSLGSNPFEIDAEGRCAWGIALDHARRPASPSWSTNETAQKARLFADALVSKRKYKPIPWTSKGPAGHSLLESILPSCPLPDFLGHVHSAFAHGADAREPFSTDMDLPCALLLRLVSLPSDPPADRLAAHAFLADHPPSSSSDAAKAAFAQAVASRSAASHHGADGSLSELLSKTHAKLDSPAASARALLREGVEALGRMGLPMPKFCADTRRSPFNSSEVDELAGLHERGALATASRPAAPGPGTPRL